jgi:hypothetical protein
MEENLAELLPVHVREHQERARSASRQRNLRRYLGEASAPAGLVRENYGDLHIHYPPAAPSSEPEPERFVIEEDLEGYETCPDPLKADSTEEFVDLLGRYRLWAGSPSFREMQRRCRGAAAASTFCKMLKKTGELPAQHLVRAFIQGCAGDDQAVKRWITAWRRLQVSLLVDA